MVNPGRQGPGQPPTTSPPGDGVGTNPSDLACAVAPGEGAARQSPVRGVGEGSEGRRGCKRGAAAEPAGGPDTDGLAEGSPAKKKKNAKQKGKGGVASCVLSLVEGGLAAAEGVTEAKVLRAMLEEVCENDELRVLLPPTVFTQSGSGPVRKNLGGDKVVEAWEGALRHAVLWQKICACNGKAQEAKERAEGQKQAAAINTVGSLFAASINNSRACSGWFAWTHFTMLFQSTSPSLMVSGKPLLSLSAAVDPMSTQAIRAATCAGDRPVFPKDALRAP